SECLQRGKGHHRPTESIADCEHREYRGVGNGEDYVYFAVAGQTRDRILEFRRLSKGVWNLKVCSGVARHARQRRRPAFGDETGGARPSKRSHHGERGALLAVGDQNPGAPRASSPAARSAKPAWESPAGTLRRGSAYRVSTAGRKRPPAIRTEAT